MEDKDRSDVDQPNPNGNAQGDETREAKATESPGDGRRRQIDDLTKAYERARDELTETMQLLRAEIAKIDLDQARTRARTWVDENPALAVFIGIGAGVIAGRLLSKAMHTEPPTFSERARLRASDLRGDAGEYADEVGAALAHVLSRAARSAEETGDYVSRRGADVAEAVRGRAEEIGGDVSTHARHAGREFARRAEDVGRDVSRRAEDVGRDVSRRASHLSDDTSRRAEEIADSLADSTDRSVRVLEDAVHDLSRTLKKRSKSASKKARTRVESGLDFTGTVADAARTAVAAVVVKKVSDWMRALR